ncbi:substrate-binding domain-containing protein [Allosalinactinospora lopnorensis]|uniref:substrate-binding domain-containing protein n=1 Tax=Allosalinactinospora lopnorensis TaxID=1352348 RepID=UPI000623BF98|nr:substrate-binding domain-containing protein [Allosalinactinospora lopnorensis]
MGRHRDEDEKAADSGSELPLAVGRDRRRRGRSSAFIALAAAFAIVLGLGITGWYVISGERGCGGQEVTLSVAVSPELVPAINKLASGFNSERYDVDGRCVKAEVRGADSANVAYGVTGGGPTTGDTDSDVWIPDSSLWANLVKRDSGEAVITDTGTSVANSPLILAQPAEAAEWDDEAGSLQNLVPTSAPTTEPTRDVRVIDPVRSASGLVTLALISGAIDDTEEGQPELIAALQTLQRGATPNEEAAFDALSTGKGPPSVLVLSEQAAWRYNTEHEEAPAYVSYPEGGSYTLDYPYLVRSEDPTISRAAELFRVWLTRDGAHGTLQAEGFRSPDGTADTDVLTEDAGFRDAPPENLPTPSDNSVAKLTQAWNQLKLDTRLLTIVDISGSMLNSVPGTDKNRMEVTTESATQGLSMFPEDAELGIWEFSTDLNGKLDYRETSPIQELSSTTDGTSHRERIADDLSRMEPKPTGDTGLYNTYLAAYREMSRSYKADQVNAILMLTDGEDDTDDGISLNQLLSTLEQESTEEQPVPIISIAFGPEVDREPLEQIAEATDGAAYTTDDPTEIGEIFLKAFSLRLQPPDTPE